MKATEILKDEHRVIERMITVLEIAASRLEAEEAVRPGLFLETVDFIKNFADGCHHKKEEGVLFKIMETHGVPVEGGPIGVMLHEHEQGRAFTRAMQEAAKNLEEGDHAAGSSLIQAALGYASLLRHHIYKEDNILFPMAKQAIPFEKHQQVLNDFEKVEANEIGEGVHEKYLALAEALEKEIS